jgi:hypothetical protein
MNIINIRSREPRCFLLFRNMLMVTPGGLENPLHFYPRGNMLWATPGSLEGPIGTTMSLSSIVTSMATVPGI